MLDYGFSLYESLVLAQPGDYACTLPCLGAEAESLNASIRDTVTAVLPKNHEAVIATTEANHHICAPVKTNDIVGYVVFRCGNSEIARVPLCADCDLNAITPEKTFIDHIKDIFAR